MDVASGDDAEEGKTGAGESPPVVDLFWRIYTSGKTKAPAGPSGELVRTSAEVTVPASCVTIKDEALRAAAAKPRGGMTVSIPYLTNKGHLRRGDELWMKKQPPVE